MTVLADGACEERHGGEEAQSLLDHTLQVFQFLQVVRVYGAVR